MQCAMIWHDMDSLRGSSDEIGTIQRRLAWPMRKDDAWWHAQIEKYNIFFLTWHDMVLDMDIDLEMNANLYIYIYMYTADTAHCKVATPRFVLSVSRSRRFLQTLFHWRHVSQRSIHGDFPQLRHQSPKGYVSRFFHILPSYSIHWYPLTISHMACRKIHHV